ncbi:MAG: outer membrane protein assembly factor BamE [Pseudomonadota bacterium]
MSTFKPLAVIAVLAAALTAEGCVSVRSAHGYVLERGETKLTARENVDTKESVIARYGEPSVRGVFGDNRWYYIANRDEARAFFRPEITSQEVVAFHFNDEGVVEKVETVGLERTVDLKMVSKVTPTRGKELSFWEQLLGNVGQLPAGGLGGQQQQGPR